MFRHSPAIEGTRLKKRVSAGLRACILMYRKIKVSVRIVPDKYRISK